MPKNENIKGQVPIALMTVKNHEDLSDEVKQLIADEINLKVRIYFGLIVRLEGFLFVNMIPKM